MTISSSLIEKLGVPVVTGWNAHDVLWNDASALCRAPRHGRRPRRQHGDAERRPAAGARQPAQHPPGQLQLEELRARGVQDLGRHRSDRAAQAHRVARHAGRGGPRRSDPGPARRALCGARRRSISEWLEWSRERVRRFPAMLPEYREHGPLDPSLCRDGRAVRAARRGRCRRHRQRQRLRGQLPGAEIKRGQRLWTNSGCATMGYDLPAAIGVVRRDRRQAARDRDRRRRQHHDEPAGDADDRGLRPAGEGLPDQQQRLCLDLPDAPQLLQRRRGRRRAQEQRHLPRFRQGRGGVRLQPISARNRTTRCPARSPTRWPPKGRSCARS